MSETEEDTADAEPMAEDDGEEAVNLDVNPGVDGGIPGVPDRLQALLPEQMKSMMAVLKQDHGIAKLLMQPAYDVDGDGEPEMSQAEFLADIINITKLQTKDIADAAGIEVEIEATKPESAAMMLQELVKRDEGERARLIDEFDRIEETREEILLELTDEETLEEHIAKKNSISYFKQHQRATEETDEE